jgi:two-component system, OmpR family, response regulator
MSVGQVQDELHRSARQTRARSADERWTRSAGVQVLIVDGHDEGSDEVVAGLAAEGISVTWCTSAVDALIEYGRLDPDAVIVAPLLDSVDAAEFVKALRRHDSGLVLVGLDAAAADAAGPLFLAGATAAVSRPYDASEVMGRLVALTANLDVRACLGFGDIELDPRAYEVRIAGCQVESMPSKEFELLRVLMLHGNQVVDTDTIRQALWGSASGAPSSNAVAVHAARLRGRLEGHARVTRVRGRGYRLNHV